MTNPYRDMCAELVEEVEHLWSIVRDDNNEPHSLANRARDLLGQPVAIECQRIRTARRPKPPSLKEQALDALSLMLMFVPPGDQREQGETIRRALEALD